MENSELISLLDEILDRTEKLPLTPKAREIFILNVYDGFVERGLVNYNSSKHKKSLDVAIYKRDEGIGAPK